MFSDHIGILIESVEIHYGRFYYHSPGVKLVDFSDAGTGNRIAGTGNQQK